MKKLWNNDNTHLDLELYNLKNDIQAKINKSLFVLLYTLDKDLLITAISQKMREDKVKVNNDMVEDLVGQIVEDMWKEIYMTDKEIKTLLKFIDTQIRLEISDLPQQKKLISAEGWAKLKK